MGVWWLDKRLLPAAVLKDKIMEKGYSLEAAEEAICKLTQKAGLQNLDATKTIDTVASREMLLLSQSSPELHVLQYIHIIASNPAMLDVRD